MNKFKSFLFITFLMAHLFAFYGNNAYSTIQQKNDNKVSVLMFHSVNNVPKNEDTKLYNSSISSDNLEKILIELKEKGFKSISLEDLYKWNYGSKSVLLTFDDGYADFYYNAVPLLEKYGYKAINGVIVDNIGDNNYMTEKQIVELSKKWFDIVNHTMRHVELDKLSYDKQVSEIKSAKLALEKIINKPVNTIIYPVGKYNENTVKAFKELNLKFGFTTKSGKYYQGNNVYEISRVRVDNRNNINNLVDNLLYY